MIPADDRGLTLGDGLFETVLCLDAAAVEWEAHLQRMAHGCRRLGLPEPDPEQAFELARVALAAADLMSGRAALRLTLTAGSGGRGLDRPLSLRPRLTATAAPAPAPKGPARLASVGIRRNESSPAARLKTLAYLDNVLARAEARWAGADEALMCNLAGEVACAAAANLFWVRDGRLYTPDLACGALAGVTRAQVIRAARAIGVDVAEARAGAVELARAEALFLTNSLIGVRPVSEWDGRVFGPSRLVARLAQPQPLQTTRLD